MFPPHPPEPVDPDWQLEPERVAVELEDPPPPSAAGYLLLLGGALVIAVAFALALVGLGAVLFGR